MNVKTGSGGAGGAVHAGRCGFAQFFPPLKMMMLYAQ